MILLDRQISLLNYLKKKDQWIKGSDLAKLIGVSDRTVRNDILAIKEICGENIIESSKCKGYRLNSNEKGKEYFLDYKSGIIKPSDRIIYIIKKLILSNEKIDFYNLADELFISDCTLECDINKIKYLLDEITLGEIEIDRNSNYITLKVNKEYRSNILYDIAKWENFDLKLHDMQKYFENLNLEYLSMFIIEIMNKINDYSRYFSMTKFLLDIALIIEAKFLYNYSYGKKMMVSNNCDNTTDLKLYHIVEEIESTIFDNFGVKISVEDKIYILNNLLNISRLDKMENKIRKLDMESDEFYKFLYEILLKVKDEFSIDFTQNKQVLRELYFHIRIAIERYKRGIKLYNPLREKIKNENLFLFTIGIKVSKKIKERYGVELDFSEISYIVAYLAAAIYKARENKNNDVKVLLLVFEGNANLKYIENEIRKLDVDRKFTVCGFSNMDSVKQLNNINMEYDLLISTYDRIDRLGHKNNIIIQKTFTIIDKIKVKETISKVAKERKLFIFRELCNEFLKPELFIKDLKVKSREEAIYNLSNLLERQGYVEEDYAFSVLEREELISTSIETGIAFPHAINKQGIKSAIAIGILRNSICWGKYKVKVVALLSYNSNNVEALNMFLSDLAEIIIKGGSLENIRKCTDFNELMNVLERSFI